MKKKLMIVALTATATVAAMPCVAGASGYMSASDGRKEARRLMHKTEVRTDATASELAGCYRDSATTMHCRAHYYYAGYSCSSLIKVWATPGWFYSKSVGKVDCA